MRLERIRNEKRPHPNGHRLIMGKLNIMLFFLAAWANLEKTFLVNSTILLKFDLIFLLNFCSRVVFNVKKFYEIAS